jgi:hypothetical protein
MKGRSLAAKILGHLSFIGKRYYKIVKGCRHFEKITYVDVHTYECTYICGLKVKVELYIHAYIQLPVSIFYKLCSRYSDTYLRNYELRIKVCFKRNHEYF